MESFIQLRKGTTPRKIHRDLDGLKDDELGRYGFTGRTAHMYRRNDPTAFRTATSVSGVSLQRFENGTVYRVVRGTTTAGLALHGDVARTYVEVGELDSRLGRPRSGIERTSTGVRARFDGGTITQRTGSAPVVTYS